jgi:hypothetical protein
MNRPDAAPDMAGRSTPRSYRPERFVSTSCPSGTSTPCHGSSLAWCAAPTSTAALAGRMVRPGSCSPQVSSASSTSCPGRGRARPNSRSRGNTTPNHHSRRCLNFRVRRDRRSGDRAARRPRARPSDLRGSSQRRSAWPTDGAGLWSSTPEPRWRPGMVLATRSA